MKKTFKALSALLSYPDEELQNAAPELRNVIDEEDLFPADSRRLLDPLLDEIATGDLYALQERYVDQFDRTRSLSLHLFEHVHGESRDRGQAMIDLKSLYEKNGLCLERRRASRLRARVSRIPLHASSDASTRAAQPDRAYPDRTCRAPTEAPLALRGSIPRSCCAHRAGCRTHRASRWCQRAPDTDPNDFAALDAQWEEEAVTFGPGAAPSCKDRLVAQIRAGRRPAADLPSLGRASWAKFINQVLFGWYPYLCLTVFLVGSLLRFDREQYTWRSGSSQLLRRKQLMWGSNLFHVGILVIFSAISSAC